uniref:Uncharacterized protein n=1 Tax=Globodera rostochiensis TaxID=31243 RepID=A0A914HQ40_GLORO
MEEFWILILVAFFATNALDKAESVKLELKTFDEIFGEGWWDKDEAAEDLKTPAPTNFGQNVHHQIDRQNTQIGQIEPNSTDQLGQIEPNSTDQNLPLTESDQLGQIEPNSTDQNLPLTESDQHGQIEPNSTDQNLPLTESDQLGQIEPNSTDQNLPLTESNLSDNAKNGVKQSKMKLGLSLATIYDWKSELGQTKPQHIYSDSEQKELMKSYYKIKDKNPKIRDKDIAKTLKIGIRTLYKWKKLFKRQQFHPNSVEENAAANVQEIGSLNSGSI